MIIFDLRCAPAGHVFEAWFGSSDDYADQRERGLVSCPICGAAEVEKAPMAPAVPKKGGASADLFSSDPATVKQMLGALAAMQRKLVEGSDWVGDSFASEARAIHLGEADARSIHGRATREQAESLAEDGIPVAPLLFPVAAPGEEN
ncbi:MAG TPA: DUF1178 family protein [Allosphingosinicella sp.]|nr:DUF1178 family protein [Allosphingosinicella sp.]